jgi:thiol-disulfide isomerase/thioredoxin
MNTDGSATVCGFSIDSTSRTEEPPMNRSQFLAAVVAAVAVVGIVVSQFTAGDQPAESAAETGSAGSATAGVSPDAASAEDDQSPEQATSRASSAAAPLTVVEPPPLLGQKPGLEGLDGWLQTDAAEFEEFDGQVRIVQFWTFGCHNCKATIPHLQEIYADWHDEGLEIIGVHAPEFSYEAEVDNIANAAVDLGVTWPIALDTEKRNFRSWQERRRFWPRTYVLDQNGQVRFDRIGEGKYQELADTVAYLIENGP